MKAVVHVAKLPFRKAMPLYIPNKRNAVILMLQLNAVLFFPSPGMQKGYSRRLRSSLCLSAFLT